MSDGIKIEIYVGRDPRYDLELTDDVWNPVVDHLRDLFSQLILQNEGHCHGLEQQLNVDPFRWKQFNIRHWKSSFDKYKRITFTSVSNWCYRYYYFDIFS